MGSLFFNDHEKILQAVEAPFVVQQSPLQQVLGSCVELLQVHARAIADLQLKVDVSHQRHAAIEGLLERLGALEQRVERSCSVNVGDTLARLEEMMGSMTAVQQANRHGLETVQACLGGVNNLAARLSALDRMALDLGFDLPADTPAPGVPTPEHRRTGGGAPTAADGVFGPPYALWAAAQAAAEQITGPIADVQSASEMMTHSSGQAVVAPGHTFVASEGSYEPAAEVPSIVSAVAGTPCTAANGVLAAMTTADVGQAQHSGSGSAVAGDRVRCQRPWNSQSSRFSDRPSLQRSSTAKFVASSKLAAMQAQLDAAADDQAGLAAANATLAAQVENLQGALAASEARASQRLSDVVAAAIEAEDTLVSAKLEALRRSATGPEVSLSEFQKLASTASAAHASAGAAASGVEQLYGSVLPRLQTELIDLQQRVAHVAGVLDADRALAEAVGQVRSEVTALKQRLDPTLAALGDNSPPGGVKALVQLLGDKASRKELEAGLAHTLEVVFESLRTMGGGLPIEAGASRVRCLSCNRGLGAALPTPLTKSWKPPLSECVSAPTSAPPAGHGAAQPRGPVQVGLATALLPFAVEVKPPSIVAAQATAGVTSTTGKPRAGSAALASFAVHSRDLTPITHAGSTGAAADEVSIPARPQSAAPTGTRAKRQLV